MQHADEGDGGGGGGGGGGGVLAAPAAVAVAAGSQRAEAGLLPGQLVAGKWRLQARIGRGAFGDIFVATSASAEDDAHQQQQQHQEPRRYAIKLEKLPLPPAGEGDVEAVLDEKAQAALAARAVLKLEAVILSKLQRYPFVGRFVEYGRDMTLGVAYLVMSLLGENLLRLRRRREGGKFSLPTVLRFGVQALRAIQAVHEIGFLHRDIKPSNFVIGSNRGTLHAAQTGVTSPLTDTGGSDIEMELMSPSKIAIIDFGLARAFRDRATGTVLPSRGSIKGFRGTPRYASVHVHREEDLSRRDDLWSLLYILVEFCTGDLPWGAKRDKDDIGAIKEKFLSLRLLKTGKPGEIPSCFVPFMQHLYSLKFESKPNYAYLIELLQRKLTKLGFGGCEGPDASTVTALDGGAISPPIATTQQQQGEDCPFDWEDTSILNTVHDGSLSVGERTVTAATGMQINVQRAPVRSVSDDRGGELNDATPSPDNPPLLPQPVLPSHDVSTSGFGATAGPGLQPQTPSLVAPAHATGASAPLPQVSPSSSIMQPDSASSMLLHALPPPAVAAASSSPSPTSAVPVQLLSGAAFPSLAGTASPAFGALPLSQPIPLPQALMLSPRKQHARGASDVPASPVLSAALGPPAVSAIALPAAAAAAKQRSKVGTSSSTAAASGSSSSSASSASSSSFAQKPPRHSKHSSLHISVAGSGAQPGPSPSPSTVLLAAIASPSPTSVRSAGSAAQLALESDDQRADMNKQRTSYLWGEDSGAQLSSRIPGASPSPFAELNGAAGDVDADAAAEADAMPDWGGFITPRGPPDRSVSVSHSERARLAVEPIHEVEEEPEDLPTHRTRSTAASRTATDDEMEEGGGGDGRTQAPGAAVGGAATDGGFDGANPAHSLNDACIHTHSLRGFGGGAGGPDHSSHAPGLAPDADTLLWRDDELPRSNSGNPPTAGSRGRSRSEVALGAAGLCLLPQALPSTSPHATPQRRVEGSMLLQDSDDSSSSSSEASSSEDAASPRPRLIAALNAAAAADAAAPISTSASGASSVSSPPKPRRSLLLHSSAAASSLSSANAVPSSATAAGPPTVVSSASPALSSESAGGFGVVWQTLNGVDALPAWTSSLALELPSSADQSLAPHAGAAPAATTETEAWLPAAAAAASASSSSGALLCASDSRSPSLSGSLRPQPPSAPPPAYSARDRSFGRFQRVGRGERSPAKPLARAIAQRIVEQHTEAEIAAAATDAASDAAVPSPSAPADS